MHITDLSTEVFLALRSIFFDDTNEPKKFPLREKKNTQDDPLDEYIALQLGKKLAGINCMKSPGPLISPDLVIYREKECNKILHKKLRRDPYRIIGIEVKKLERGENGKIARASGMDYNTTPPCGTIRIYDLEANPIDIRGFYLFVCLEIRKNAYFISALSLCDGDLLNEDFNLYLKIVGKREKEINLGTYGDGANRNRPMLIFSNPLGAEQLDRISTLITKTNLTKIDSRLGLVYQIKRKGSDGKQRIFFVHQKTEDVDNGVQEIVEPFPQPKTRVTTTQRRGLFRISI